MEKNKANKTIIITGVSSFIGIHLVKKFTLLGYRTIGTISKSKECYVEERLQRINLALNLGATIETLDLTCKKKVINFIKFHKPCYWIHHAGWAKDYHSKDYNLDIAYEVNISPLDYIYEALNSINCSGVVLTGSSAEYSNTLKPSKEEDICEPNMPYGVIKLNQTLKAKQLSKKFSIPTRVARVFIPFGILDAPSKLLPSVIVSLSKNKPIELSSCNQVRDFIYIDDLVQGYYLLIKDIEKREEFDIFNLSSGEPIKLKNLLLSIANKMDADPINFKFGSNQIREGESNIILGDNSKAKSILQWKPESLSNRVVNYIE